MFIWTLNGRSLVRRVAILLVLSLVTFAASTLGVRGWLRAVAEGEDRPLTRANSPDDRVALTFDVTWGQDELLKILATLEAQRVQATFFAGGTFLSLNPELVRQISAKGHEVGTLGQKIVDLSVLPQAEVLSSLLASQSMLSKTLGGPVRYFRPPQGEATTSVVQAARSAELITVTQSLDAEDYLDRKAVDLAGRVVKRAVRGDIIRLTASDWSKETAKALPAIITGLKGRGFKFVLISELAPG